MPQGAIKGLNKKKEKKEAPKKKLGNIHQLIKESKVKQDVKEDIFNEISSKIQVQKKVKNYNFYRFNNLNKKDILIH